MLLELQRAFRDGILTAGSQRDDPSPPPDQPGAGDPDANALGAIGIVCDGIASTSRFAVHRTNTLGSLRTALEAAFPVVARLVGDRFFRFAAKEFVIRNAPRQPQLFTYGAAFSDFLAAFPPARSVPYLADVARLEWARSEAYFAADAEPLDPAHLSGLGEGASDRLRLTLHPATRLVTSAFPILSIWDANQPENETVPAINATGGESVLVVRPRHAIRQELVSNGVFAFLAALANGAPLADAAVAALTIDPELDLQSTLATHFTLGTFSGATSD